MLNNHEASVRVATEGGRGTSAIWGRSQIDNEGLKKAIEISVEKYGLFKEVIKINGSDYILSVQLLALDQPLAGFNMQVRMSTLWTLLNNEEEKIWEKFIVSTYKASFGESILGVERLKKANEGAAREVIKEGIEDISKLDLR